MALRGGVGDVHAFRRGVAVLATCLVPGCTYGPDLQRATIDQVVRIGDSYRAVVLVRHDTYQLPTGLSAFPDGGKWRYSVRKAAQYLVDARTAEQWQLAEQDAPDELWESFGAWIAGLDDDSALYVRLNGCRRGGECWGDLVSRRSYRVSMHGALEPIDSIPIDARLPASMGMRSPDERAYVRFETKADTLLARFEENGTPRPLFRVRPDGSLVRLE